MISLRPCVDVLDADGDLPSAACSLIICSYTSFQWSSKLKIATGFMLFLPPPLPATAPSWFFSMYLSNSTVCTFSGHAQVQSAYSMQYVQQWWFHLCVFGTFYLLWFCYHQWVYVIVVSLFLHTNTPTHIPRQSWFINLLPVWVEGWRRGSGGE